MTPLSEILEDRTIRAVVVRAVLGQVLQGSDHSLHLGNFCAQVLDMLHRQSLDVVARSLTIVPEGQQIVDLQDGKAQVACAADELERVNVVLGVNPVASWRTVGGFNEGGPLIIPGHFC